MLKNSKMMMATVAFGLSTLSACASPAAVVPDIVAETSSMAFDGATSASSTAQEARAAAKQAAEAKREAAKQAAEEKREAAKRAAEAKREAAKQAAEAKREAARQAAEAEKNKNKPGKTPPGKTPPVTTPPVTTPPVTTPPVTTPPVTTAPPVTTPPSTGVLTPLATIGEGTNPNFDGYLFQTVPEALLDISGYAVNTTLTNNWLNEYNVPSGDHFHLDNTMPVYVTSTPVYVSLGSVTVGDESDLTPVPLSLTTTTESGIMGTAGAKNANSDHHTLEVDKSNGRLYELYQTAYSASTGKYSAYSETVWNTEMAQRRPYGWTSADVAGLPVLPLLLRYDEVANGVIAHALRVTFNNTSGSYILPATHGSGVGSDAAIPGMRIRLKASFDITKFSKSNQVILTALKTYGAYVADNGSNMYFSANNDSRWDTDDVALMGAALTEANFEVVQTTPVINTLSPPTGAAPVIGSFTSAVSGSTVTLTWAVTGSTYSYIKEAPASASQTSTTTTYKSGATYTLVANNLYGSTTKVITVK